MRTPLPRLLPSAILLAGIGTLAAPATAQESDEAAGTPESTAPLDVDAIEPVLELGRRARILEAEVQDAHLEA